MFYKFVKFLTDIGKWIGVLTMTLVMLFITANVIGRMFGMPILGSVEIVQLSMVVMIMFGIAYTQAENSHITIDLVVDKFPKIVQQIISLISDICLVVVCFIIGWVSLQSAYEHLVVEYRTTMLLGIPLYPFKYIVSFGYILWGLGALVNIFKNLTDMTTKTKEG